ncbi:MAG: hypothetical protein WA996_18965 [Candidatus Promineifilaceae bacterium]
MDDDLDSLREKTKRASSVYDDLEGEPESQGGLAGTFASFSPLQRLILIFLLFLNMGAFACAILVVAGVIAT